jgi:indole-3-glycerol phosphate synthase
MAQCSRERVAAARALEAEAAVLERAHSAPAPLTLALAGFDLIAELKLRSPAAGGLAGLDFDANRQLDAYVAGGAAVVSVLTEPTEFNGSLDDLRMASTRLAARGCPVMRKDFLVDAYQVLEARANGASGVLLIATMLSDAALADMIATAAELGLFILIEAFDTDDLDRLARLDLPAGNVQTLIGVNSRDLKTLAVDFERFAQLADQSREDVPAVAESGIESQADIEEVAGSGYSLALVGSALMRDGDSQRAVADFIGAGRAVVSGRRACS